MDEERAEGRLTGWIAVVLEAHDLQFRDDAAADRLYREGIERYPESASLHGYYALFLQYFLGEYDRAEANFRRALEIEPEHVENLGSYAVFLETVRKDHDGAEQFYRRALEIDPNHANNAANYALFLDVTRHDYDAAERYYERAVRLDPGDANHVGNYAMFLELAREDFDRADRYYRQAIEAEPTHLNNLQNYAVFLELKRKDLARAEEVYRTMVRYDRSKANLNALGNLAGVVLARGDTLEGFELLDGLLSKLPNPAYAEIELEGWFYAFAHWPAEERPRALAELKRLLVAGVRSPDWDFSANIERARLDGQADMQWVELLADVITRGADIARLDEWEAWQAAIP